MRRESLSSPRSRHFRSDGLKPTRRIFRDWLSPELVIGMFPDWYGPPRADWPPQVRLAGFPLFDGEARGNLPSGLLEFCRAGKQPIVFTFGTGMMHAASLFASAVEACGKLGRRGILLTKFPSQLPTPLPPFVRQCEFASFPALFPHCAVVVHHGGIGTTAKALAAGVPQLILPFAFDQLDNAVRVARLGTGACLKGNRRNGAVIAKAIAELMTSQRRERCRGLATRFGNEDALETAAGWVEALAIR